MRFRFLDFDPTVREKLVKLTGFHAIYTGENIGQIFNRVDIIALAGRNEREMGCSSHAASIRANEKTIFAHQDKGFNSTFTLVIIQSSQLRPMMRRIVSTGSL